MTLILPYLEGELGNIAVFWRQPISNKDNKTKVVRISLFNQNNYTKFLGSFSDLQQPLYTSPEPHLALFCHGVKSH